MTRQPVLFVSHGAPDLAIADNAASRFLRLLGERLPRPRVAVVMSAHHEAKDAEISGGVAPATIHDFGGFDPRLRAMRYPAPGSPALAYDMVDRLRDIGIAAHVNRARGFDHGIWVPLSLLLPHADVPVLSLSISPDRDAAWHAKVGRALAPLRDDGVLLIGSGSATHDLRSVFGARHDAPPPWVTDFADWLAERVEAGDEEALLDAVARGPHGKRNHPTPDHILPLPFAVGGADGDGGRVLHRSIDRAVLAMDVYGWGEPALIDRLADRMLEAA